MINIVKVLFCSSVASKEESLKCRGKIQSVSTGADRLYNLVQDLKEVSFQNAAKKLGIPVSTIEAWATFLQEDNLLSVKYKFTTPYLILPAATKKKKDERAFKVADKPFIYKVEEAEVRSNFDRIRKSLRLVSDDLNKGEFGVLDGLEHEIVKLFKRTVQFIQQNTNASPQTKSELAEHLASVEKKINNAVKLLKQKKFDQASNVYFDSHSRMNELLKKTEAEFGEHEQASVDDKFIRELFDRTYDLLDQDKADEAVETYDKAMNVFAALSEKIRTEKSELQENIVRLNRDLALRTNEIRSRQMANAGGIIRELIKGAYDSIKKKKFVAAKAYYLEIAKVFGSLPVGFEKEKRGIKRDVLRVFEKISKDREANLKKSFDSVARQISGLLDRADKHFDDLKLVMGAYRQIQSLYVLLPAGFIKEKMHIYGKVIALHKALMQRLEYVAEDLMNKRTVQIMMLLNDMKRQVDSNDLDAATHSYALLNGIFSDLPRGFIERKVEIQERIIDVYEAFLEKKDNVKKERFYTTVRDLEKLISEAEKVVSLNDYSKAYAVYKRIKRCYVMLRPIKASSRRSIRDKILIVYRRILMLRSQQEESALKLPPLIHVDSRKSVNERIERLKAESKAKVRVLSA